MSSDSNTGWRTRFRHAFQVAPGPESLTEVDQILVDRIARFISDRGLMAPAVAALESSRPYTFLGSQFLLFLKPFAHIVLPGPDYDRFTKLIENRSSIDHILDALAKADRVD